MSWLFSQELVLQYNCRYDNVLTKFASMEVTCENLSTLSNRIQAEKERARVLLPVLCKCEEGARPIWTEYWTEEELGISGENRQGWICTLLWCVASILKRQKDDAKTYNGDGVADWATNTIRRGCTPQEWEQAGQQARKFGINDAIRTFQNAWPQYEAGEGSEWTVCVNLPSLQGLVEEYLAASFLDGAPSVLSNTNLMPQAYLCSDRTTAFSTRSLSGMMFAPLTADLGGALLTWFRGAFPVRTLAARVGAMDSAANVPASGQKWSGSFAKYDRTLFLWKTHQCSLLGDWEPFLETWPRWGLMLNGECWERTMLVALTKDTAFGLLPTPMATDWKGGTASIRKDTGKQRLDQFRDWCKSLHGLTYPIPEHSEAVMMWPVGWSDLKPLAMDKFRQWQQRHSGFYQGVIGELQ